MLLIYPPAARSSEPPLGIARLAAFLRSRDREALCLDLCQEGIEQLLGRQAASADRWTRGALRRRESAADSLRDLATYRNADRYARAVSDLNRAMRAVSSGHDAPAAVQASLADYRESERSPLRRIDLIDSAVDYRSNLFYPLFERRLRPALEASRDGFAGVSLCYLSQALCAFAIVGYIKAIAPETRVIMGGGLVTSWVSGGSIDAAETFDGLVDAVLPGPGEQGLGALLGIGGDSVRNRHEPSPPPDFADFADLRYFSPITILPYNFSFGCPWKRCSFCPESAENLQYRGTPVEKAMGEIRLLDSRHRPGLYHFTDNEISPLYLRALADRPPAAPWYGFARFSHRLLDRGFCEALAASGCVMLQLGLESGDQRVLDALGKGTRLEEISQALDNLAHASIGVYLYVLFGTPAEDSSAAARTRDFIAEHACHISYMNIAIFNLPASGSEARELETRSFYEGDLALYSEFKHPKGWDRAEVRDFLAHDLGSIPAIRAILRRTPPVFTSNHAAFFLNNSRDPRIGVSTAQGLSERSAQRPANLDSAARWPGSMAEY